MGKRHNSRVAALKILYSADIKEELSQLSPEVFPTIQEGLSEKITDFTIGLVLGVSTNREKIDRIIAETSKNWKVERMSIIDRNILRLGIQELLSGEPAAIVINEAILLACDFGSDNSTSFINGILDNSKKKINCTINEPVSQ